MLPFVGVALRIQQKMEIADKKGAGITMRFAKIYSPEKCGHIVEVAQSYPWWRKNPVAAFMKAVGQVNREEKESVK
jgi:hypothetical protein